MPKHPADEAVFGPPVIKSCLMHPERPNAVTIKIESLDPEWAGITYGLCEYCQSASKMFSAYRKGIQDTIQKRFTQLKKERENV